MSSPFPPDTASESPLEYPVSIWETIGIAAGAIFLVAVGLMGLGVKALNNAFNPQRAEAIAHSIISYQIPGGAKGAFGANVGGAKIAVVSSQASLGKGGTPSSPIPTIPATELLVARIPASQETEELNSGEAVAGEFFSGFSFSYQSTDAFQVKQTETEYKTFCGQSTPVAIQRGELTLPDQVTQLPAVKYQALIDRETASYMAILVAVGQDASNTAETVFRSLQCVQEQ
ncbi:MAG TPA: hypothetical protein V6C65_01160 [Allocoleopsis sp.]